MMKRISVYLLLFCLTILPLKGQRLCLWNQQSVLNVLSSDSTINHIRNNFITESEKIVGLLPISVVDKNKSLSGDIHNYESIGPYWWPDPNNTNGPYIRKDGVINPEYYDYDNIRLETLSKRLKCLAIAYFVSKDNKYFDCYIKQIKTWFVDKKTRMNPNMDYAQMIVGITNGKGRAAGLIEAYFLNDVIESLRLVMSVKKINKALYKKTLWWFREFKKWLIESEIGKESCLANENHGIAYDVTLYNLCLFVGDKKNSKEINHRFSCRLEDQITLDGKMPRELVRTRAFHYSILNLQHIIDFCMLQSSQGNNFYLKNKTIIDRACNYLLQFVGHKNEWPYEEIGNWNYEEQRLQAEISRLDYLR